LPAVIRKHSTRDAGQRLPDHGVGWEGRAPRQVTASRDGAEPFRPRRDASQVLASCNVKTLYLRNVPDEVVARLQRLAARDATSVGAVAVRELTEVSKRADNAGLLGALGDLDVGVDEIVAAVDAGRSGQ
jgi:hypothetical protein